MSQPPLSAESPIMPDHAAAEPPSLRTRLLAAFRHGNAGGPVLMAAAVLALALANSPLGGVYDAVLHFPLGLTAGRAAFVQSVEGWINDGLMALFFLLVGLEIRGEVTEGQLASLPRAAAPAVAALGGMLAPAAVFAACAWSDKTALRGWAIPVATDIAFTLAAIRLLGPRVPAGLRVFLTALAIIDDLAAILVIAVFYTADLRLGALAAGGLVWLGLAALNRAGVRSLAPYMAGFVVLWVLLTRSGVHPTLAGVAVAFVVPMAERDGDSPARTLEHWLVGWVAYLVVPLFGLANAGLHLTSLGWEVLRDPVVPGIVLGLFLGKQAGVFGATWAAVRLRLVRLPAQLSWPLLYGGSVLCGIGFTISLFIGHLAFPGGERVAEVKAAVLAGSLLSALAGMAVLAWVTRRGRSPTETLLG